VDAHPLGIDIGDAQGAHLRNPQTRRIGGGNDGFVFDRADPLKEGEDLFQTQNDREDLRAFGVGDVLDHLRPLQSDRVQKFKGIDVLILSEWGDFPLLGKMKEKVSDLSLPHRLRGPHVIFRELLHTPEVALLRVRAVGLQNQVLSHPVA